jgi:hypothetical protein
MPLQTTRYAKSTDNKAVTHPGIAPVICNYVPGVYASAAPVIEDVAYPMANLLDYERAYVWKVPARAWADDDVCVEIDLGPSGTTIGAIGFLGFNFLDPASASETFVAIKYKTAADGWGASWSPIGEDSFIVNKKDLIFSCIDSEGLLEDVRFLQFRFISSGGSPGWALGKFFAGVMTDLGFAYGIGSAEASVIPRSRVSTMDGTQYLTEYGGERRLFSLKFDTILHSTKNQLMSLVKEIEPFVLHAPSGEAFECRSTSDGGEASAVFGVVGYESVDVWSMEVSFESLP